MTQPPTTPGAAAPPAIEGPVPAPDRPQVEARTAVLVIAGFAAVLLVALLALLPVPYAVLQAGPVINTLGHTGNRPLISVSGHPTYRTSGQLDLTTVSVIGGPGSRTSLWEAVTAWLDSGKLVLPVEDVFDPKETAKQSDAQNQAEMVSSQESATAAALSALHIPVRTTLTIDQVDRAAPAAATLRSKDVIRAVDGTPITELTQLRELLQKVKPGAVVPLTVRRAGRDVTLQVRTVRGTSGQTLLGVFIDPTFHFPFTVKIQIENIGGPSAGMMFALGIVDTLTPGSLTGGRRIAGTGTIEANGEVGPIGGIQQKMIGARQAGARWFLAPGANCSEVRGHVPGGMRVVRVDNLEGALSAIRAIAAGRGTSLGGC